MNLRIALFALLALCSLNAGAAERPNVLFIVCDDFQSVSVTGDFAKSSLDLSYVKQREQLATRAWLRLKELRGKDIPIIDYPLPEVQAKFNR